MDVDWQLLVTSTGVALGVGYVVYRIIRWSVYVNVDRSAFAEFMEAVRTDIKEIRTDLADIRTQIAGILTRLDGVETRLDGVETRLDGVETRLDGVETRLDGFDLRFPAAIAGTSPARLTEFGERLSDYMEAGAWAAGRAPSLVSEVEGFEPFEIDQFCDAYVREQLDEDDRKIVGRCAYQFAVEQPIVLSVLRVLLRDELLEATGATAEQPAS